MALGQDRGPVARGAFITRFKAFKGDGIRLGSIHRSGAAADGRLLITKGPALTNNGFFDLCTFERLAPRDDGCPPILGSPVARSDLNRFTGPEERPSTAIFRRG